MTWRAWLSRLRGSFSFRTLNREMDEEMRFHLDMATERNVRSGLSPSEARRRAQLAFGSAELFKEEARGAARARPLENFLSDARIALRNLRRSPAFTALTLATLGLGVGGTATVYAAARVLLIDRLPFRSAEELVLVQGRNALRGLDVLPASYPDFEEWRASGVFQELAAWTSYPGSTAALEEGVGGPEDVQRAYVSENLFRTLGVEAVAGQAFLPEDAEAGSTPAIVLAYGLWRRRFGGDPAVLGSTIAVEGRSFTVRGVLPATFRFAAYPRDAELYIPLAHEPNPSRQLSRGTRYLAVVGRLAPDVELHEARTRLTELAARIEQLEAVNEGYTVAVRPLREVLLGDRRTSITLLAGGCLVLLLIAAVNVASLFLARAHWRGRELAVRHALGGGRRRIAWGFVAESLWLGLGAAGVAWVVASWWTRLLTPFLRRPPSYLVPFDLVSEPGIALDWSASVVAIAVSIGAGALAALGALPQVREGLALLPGSAGSRGTESFGAVRTRRRLVVLETALATVLLCSAGLLGRSLWKLRTTDPGFLADELFAAGVRLSPNRYQQPDAVQHFWDSVLERLGGAQGTAAAVEFLPLSGADQSTGLLIEGVPIPPPAERPLVHHRGVSAGYFRLMSIPVLVGREHGAADGRDAARVAVVNATLARRLFPEGDAVGRRVTLDFEAMLYQRDGPPVMDPELGYRTIVGVVGDVRSLALDEEPRPELYTPFVGASARMGTLVFRAQSSPAAASAVRAAFAEVDPAQSFGRLEPVSDVVSRSVLAPRSRTIVLGAFGATAVLLAAVGIYGLVSFSVTRRRRELGIRLALGASSADLRLDVLAEALKPVLVALGPGLLGGWLTVRALRAFLYGTTPLDPWTFTLVPLFLLGVGCAAAILPARRAAAADPAEIIRSE